jgi:hypothetical protein
LTAPAIRNFQHTPKIVITTSELSDLENVGVLMTVSQPGKNSNGDYCRQDNVALPMKGMFPNENGLSAADLLTALSN